MLNNVQDDAVATLHLVSITRVHAYTHITYHTHTHARARTHIILLKNFKLNIQLLQ